MKILHSLCDTRHFVNEIKKKGLSMGLVPTMGALHEGHLSLVRESKRQCDVTIVSIFVNPTQFGPKEDFKAYPRTMDEDSILLKKEGVDAIFSPSSDDMYPQDGLAATQVFVPELSTLYCGVSRPHFFNGVCMLVSRLFHCIPADKAFFGEKDFQQLTIIKKMVRDLLIPIHIVGCPLIREKNGLAMSSRNRYLSGPEFDEASRLYLALSEARQSFYNGETSSHILTTRIRSLLIRNGYINMDYCVLVNPVTLQEEAVARKGARLLVAGWIGKTRLIDTLML